MSLNSTGPMQRDILAQPASLGAVLRHQLGEGASALASAADLLRDAQRIVFTGMGGSLFAAMAAASYLEEHGHHAEAVDSSELLYFRSSSLDARTAVVLVSRSGESVEVVKLIPVLRDRGVTSAISITDDPNSTLAREIQPSIRVGAGEDLIVAIQSYTGTLTTLLLLATAVVHGKTDFTAAAQIPPLAAQSIHTPDDWTAFVAGQPVIYLLGRGASLASAHEGALLFHESARTVAVPMSIAQFRHGPVEAVDSGFRAILFASQSRSRDWDLALAEDLTRLGAVVRVCQAPPSTPPPFETVLEILPVQRAALAFAISKGLDGSAFRYGTKVTATEAGFAPA